MTRYVYETHALLDEHATMAAALLDHHAADVVVTMGCGDACPVYPGKRYLD